MNNREILTRLLEPRRKPLYEFKSWDSFKRELAQVALDNLDSKIKILFLDWISRGDNAPAHANNLFDALYIIEFNLQEHSEGFWYETSENSILFQNCLFPQACPVRSWVAEIRMT